MQRPLFAEALHRRRSDVSRRSDAPPPKKKARATHRKIKVPCDANRPSQVVSVSSSFFRPPSARTCRKLCNWPASLASGERRESIEPYFQSIPQRQLPLKVPLANRLLMDFARPPARPAPRDVFILAAVSSIERRRPIKAHQVRDSAMARSY